MGLLIFLLLASLVESQLVFHHSTEVTDATLPQLVEKEPWLLFFYADFVAACKEAAPFWDEFAREMSGSHRVGHVNLEHSKSLRRWLGVEAVPSVMLLKDGETLEAPSRATELTAELRTRGLERLRLLARGESEGKRKKLKEFAVVQQWFETADHFVGTDGKRYSGAVF